LYISGGPKQTFAVDSQLDLVHFVGSAETRDKMLSDVRNVYAIMIRDEMKDKR
jgi:hypothetical protein